MEDDHRKHIIKNINDLVRLTNYSDLVNACVRRNLISNVMRDRIESVFDSDENEKHKQLFLKLTRRGPKAYGELIDILINLQCSTAATLLCKLKYHDSQYISMNPAKNNSIPIVPPAPAEVDKPSKDNVDSNVTLQPFTNKSQLTSSFQVKKSDSLYASGQVPIYSMKSKNRGVLFLVNIIEFSKNYNKKRQGAEKDGDSLLYLFLELGFTCFSYKNLTAVEFFEALGQLRSSEYLKQTECFIMALMSHGEMTDDMHDRVEFSDGSVVKTKDIEDEFLNNKCPSLMHKPKVLIFPFCRGMAPDKGVPLFQHDSIEMNAPTMFRNIATLSDMLVCYASVRGYQAIREPQLGSWYIRAFCKVLAENAHNMDFERMLKLIGHEMLPLRLEDGSLQTPAYYNHGFNKLLYFNPGINVN